MPVTTDEAISAVLDADSVAVVGCSTTPGKAAHDVPAYLKQVGYDIYPVNPYADEIFGRKAVESVTDLPESIDLVCVFRPSEEVPRIVDDVFTHGAIEGIWTQRGIVDQEALDRAETAGLTVVQDRCMKVDHQRLLTSSQ